MSNQEAKALEQDAAKTTDCVAPSLALTLLWVGLGYALPVLLFPVTYALNGFMSPEILNLYCLVSWMGLAHFVYAYHGQAKALTQMKSRIPAYLLSLLAGGIVFWLLRWQLGFELFGFLVWIYFIPHFMKAEQHFSRQPGSTENPGKWFTFWFPTLGFAYFTFALFGVHSLPQASWLLVIAASLCLGIGVWGGALQRLKSRQSSPYILLAFFFIAEGLIWGTYHKYMAPQFQQGVYIFHIAIASFYHYFRSYYFAARKQARENKTYLWGILAINLAIIGLGYVVLKWETLSSLAVVFDVRFFTFWVGMHLLASDVFNRLKQ